jgi:hypothetical protein
LLLPLSYCNNAANHAEVFNMTSSAYSPSAHRSATLAPTLDQQTMHAISDDECVSRLASAVDQHDDQKLREVVMLISRLAVTIE